MAPTGKKPRDNERLVFNFAHGQNRFRHKVRSLIEQGEVDLNSSRFGSFLHSAAYSHNIEAIQLLIELGAEIETGGVLNSVITGERTANDETNQYQGRSDAVRIARFLIEHGADIEGNTDGGGISPLHAAAEHNYLDIARLLIDEGADIEGKANNGTTALHTAVRHGSVDVARLLIENGADTMTKDESGYRPLKIARSNRRWPQYSEELVDLLETRQHAALDRGITWFVFGQYWRRWRP